jgi:putative glycerol-1-phosphate prenyltransferase
MTLKETIQTKRAAGQKMLAVLVDPEKFEGESTPPALRATSPVSGEELCEPDFWFVGGSTGESAEAAVRSIKAQSDVPVVLFPGNVQQFVESADALLMLSLVSGRNPALLIGAQVSVARRVRACGIDTVSVGYILVDGGRLSSVEKASGTKALTDTDEIVDTAIAAELLGMESVYLEAGSGALRPVSEQIIRAVREQIHVPLIVGGGIRTVEQMLTAYDAGADIVVIGNHFEEHPEEMEAFCMQRPPCRLKE